MTLHIGSIAFVSSAAGSWEELQGRLRESPHPVPIDWKASPACLPARAVRRLSPQILLALSVAERIASELPQEAAWVFASSIGEGETLQVILETLRTPEMLVQPLRFQNAVHNAASGQWTIAAGLTGPATSIGAYAQTIGAGFLKAAMQVALERRPVGLVCYDVPLPDPLDALHPLGLPIGAGFALTPDAGPETVATFEVSLCDHPASAPVTETGRALMASRNPIAAVLPLLERLAGFADGDVVFGLHGGGGLQVRVTPR